jgi:O-antigen ligase
LLFSAGFQHLDINYRKIISGAKVAAVLGLFFACYEVFYLGLDRAGVEVNHINFGFAAGIVGVFLVVKWCGGENKKNWLREGSFTLAAIIALIFSGSRGPFLAFSVILICLLSIHASSAFKSKQINLKSKMLLAFLAVNIGLGSLLLFPRTYSEIVDPSLTSPKIRLELAKEGVKQILETPLLGIGSDQAGRFLRSLEDEVLSQFNHLHNTPLNISLELGVFGGLSFLWAIVFLIAYFYKARAWAQSNAVLNGILIILFIFIASLFNDAMSHSYARKLIAFYFSICLVLLHRSIKNPPCK